MASEDENPETKGKRGEGQERRTKNNGDDSNVVQEKEKVSCLSLFHCFKNDIHILSTKLEL